MSGNNNDKGQKGQAGHQITAANLISVPSDGSVNYVEGQDTPGGSLGDRELANVRDFFSRVEHSDDDQLFECNDDRNDPKKGQYSINEDSRAEQKVVLAPETSMGTSPKPAPDNSGRYLLHPPGRSVHSVTVAGSNSPSQIPYDSFGRDDTDPGDTDPGLIEAFSSEDFMGDGNDSGTLDEIVDVSMALPPIEESTTPTFDQNSTPAAPASATYVGIVWDDNADLPELPNSSDEDISDANTDPGVTPTQSTPTYSHDSTPTQVSSNDGDSSGSSLFPRLIAYGSLAGIGLAISATVFNALYTNNSGLSLEPAVQQVPEITLEHKVNNQTYACVLSATNSNSSTDLESCLVKYVQGNPDEYTSNTEHLLFTYDGCDTIKDSEFKHLEGATAVYHLLLADEKLPFTLESSAINLIYQMGITPCDGEIPITHD